MSCYFKHPKSISSRIFLYIPKFTNIILSFFQILIVRFEDGTLWSLSSPLIWFSFVFPPLLFSVFSCLLLVKIKPKGFLGFWPKSFLHYFDYLKTGLPSSFILSFMFYGCSRYFLWCDVYDMMFLIFFYSIILFKVRRWNPVLMTKGTFFCLRVCLNIKKLYRQRFTSVGTLIVKIGFIEDKTSLFTPRPINTWQCWVVK